MEGRRLSRPGHRNEGDQLITKAVYHNGCHDKQLNVTADGGFRPGIFEVRHDTIETFAFLYVQCCFQSATPRSSMPASVSRERRPSSLTSSSRQRHLLVDLHCQMPRLQSVYVDNMWAYLTTRCYFTTAKCKSVVTQEKNSEILVYFQKRTVVRQCCCY